MNCSARRPCFIDHLFLTFDFGQVPRRNFLQFFPFLVHCCFRCRNFHSLRHRNKCETNYNTAIKSHLCLQDGLRDLKVQNSPCAFWWIHWLPEYTQVLSCFLSDPPLPQFFIILQGIAGATGVSNFLRSFLMVSLNSLSSGSMK